VIEYPERESFFAIRFLRLLTKSAAAMEIGTDGCVLLMVIVGQEDACRYNRPVNFWNAQLATLCGIPANNETQLRRVRDRCVKAGWLVYESGGRRKHGRYFVAIPPHVDPSNDGGCDESPEPSVRQSDANPTPSERNVCADRAQSVRKVCAECAPSSPNPSPIPNPKSAAAPPPGPAQAAEADPLGMESIPPAPTPPPVPPGDWIDWKRSRRIYVSRSDESGNLDDWRDLFRTAGPKIMAEAYAALIPAIPPPKGVGYVAMQRWIFDHYQEDGK
jgi:hypothetical protein